MEEGGESLKFARRVVKLIRTHTHTHTAGVEVWLINRHTDFLTGCGLRQLGQLGHRRQATGHVVSSSGRTMRAAAALCPQPAFLACLATFCTLHISLSLSAVAAPLLHVAKLLLILNLCAFN